MKALRKGKEYFSNTTKIFRKSSSISKRTANNILLQIKKHAHKKLLDKYQTDTNSLNIKLTNDIIYNEKGHLVAIFKDYLILDDTSEFFKRSYSMNELKLRLPRIFEFYESFSKIFANYIILPESKYLYKNIQRKQKLIDNMQKLNNEEQEKDSDKIFNTDIYNSIMNQTTHHDDNLHKNLGNIVGNITTTNGNPIINQNIQKLINQINSGKPIGNNSVDSIELLIDSIGKAEKLNSKEISNCNNEIKQNIREINQLYSPTPCAMNTNSLLNNFNKFHKSKVIIQTNNEKKKNSKETEVKPNNNLNNINNNMLTSYKDTITTEYAKHIKKGSEGNFFKNNLISDKLINKKDNIEQNNEKIGKDKLSILASFTNRIKSNIATNLDDKNKPANENYIGNKNVIINQKNVNKPSVVSDKTTSSVPKLQMDKIFCNLNLMNKYKSEGTENNLVNLKQPTNRGTIEEKESTSRNINYDNGFAREDVLKSNSNEPHRNNTNRQIYKTLVKNDNNYNNTHNNTPSTTNFTKKKTFTPANNFSSNKSIQKQKSLKNTNNSGLTAKYATTSNVTNNVSIFTNAQNYSLSKSKNNTNATGIITNVTTGEKLTPVAEYNSANGRSENKENSIRAILHRGLFDGEVNINTDRILKKNVVENIKVNIPSNSKIRDNFISRNSKEKVGLDAKDNYGNTINTTDRNNYTTNSQQMKMSPVKTIDSIFNINATIKSLRNNKDPYLHNKVSSNNDILILKKSPSIFLSSNQIKQKHNLKNNILANGVVPKSMNKIESTTNLSRTPNKEQATKSVIHHRNAKSNFLVGDSNSNGHIFSKAIENVNKLNDPKSSKHLINYNTHTPNANKTEMKINNYTDLGKLCVNSYTSRTNNNKKLDVIQNYNKKD